MPNAQRVERLRPVEGNDAEAAFLIEQDLVAVAHFPPPPPGSPRLLAPEQTARDDHAHDLVGAFQDLVHSQIAQMRSRG